MRAIRFKTFAARRFTQDDFDILTEEEEQLLKMMRRGKSVIQAADALHISPATVTRRERSIMAKLTDM